MATQFQSWTFVNPALAATLPRPRGRPKPVPNVPRIRSCSAIGTIKWPRSIPNFASQLLPSRRCRENLSTPRAAGLWRRACRNDWATSCGSAVTPGAGLGHTGTHWAQHLETLQHTRHVLIWEGLRCQGFRLASRRGHFQVLISSILGPILIHTHVATSAQVHRRTGDIMSPPTVTTKA